ncbi:MAG: ATPase, T2SS/T4P/T4SS family [Elusimicrobiota bacterium]
MNTIGVLNTDTSVSSLIFSINLALSVSMQTGKQSVFADCCGVRRNLPDNIFRKLILLGSNLQSGVLFKEFESPLAPLFQRGEDDVTFVIAALGSRFGRSEFSQLDGCSIILVLVSPDSISIKRAELLTNEFVCGGIPSEKIKLILDFSTVKDSLDRKSTEAQLKREVFSEIPYDPGVYWEQLNTGEFAVLSKPYSAYSRSVKMLAREVLNWVEKAASKQVASERVSESTHGYSGTEQLKGLVTGETNENAEPVDLTALKQKLHEKFIREVDLNALKKEDSGIQKGKTLKEKVEEKIFLLLDEEKTLNSRESRLPLVKHLIDDILGLGPIEPLLSDPDVSEIMVNGRDRVFIEKKGKIFLSGIKFHSDKQLMTVIERILSGVGRKVDESTPLVDARLKDGSRVNVIIPPLSLIGPCVTIRKFPGSRPDIEFLINAGSLSRQMAEFIRACVLLKKNIILSGGTGSGKTTLLNIISSFIPEDERIVTIEDSAELKLMQEHVISLESRPANLEGAGEIPIRRLVMNALRMRPDRIVVGECRGGEALDMLVAMNTGHEGSMTTVHANSPKDAVSRLITMVTMAGTELPEKAVREQISAAVDMIIQVARLGDGGRKIMQICELHSEGDNMDVREIFIFNRTGVSADKKIEGCFEMRGSVDRYVLEAKTKLGDEVINEKIFYPVSDS